MALIAVSGEPGCRHEDLARLVADRLPSKLVTGPALEELVVAQFGELSRIPDRAWQPLASCTLATLAAGHANVIVCCLGAEVLVQDLPGVLRFRLMAPESTKLHNLAVGAQNRSEAKSRLREMMSDEFQIRKRRFGQKTSPLTSFDLVVNEQAMELPEMVEILTAAVKSRGLLERGPLSAQAAAQFQFQLRWQLARYGILLPDRARADPKTFGHPSEEVFANLLDFYRIAWHYEPRSFPLQWDKDGKVSEAFTPDFYLPEFDLYVELTTMKQANVTRKNRKVRLLRAIYPHVNIQVFYKRDVQELVLNRRLPDRLAR